MARERILAYLGIVLATLAVCVLFFGCGSPPAMPTSNDLNWPKKGRVVFVGSCIVTMPEQANEDRVARITSAIEFTLDRFMRQEGRMVKPVMIGVTDADAFSCWTDVRPLYRGCWCSVGRRETILVSAMDDTVPALYHELFHSAVWGEGHGEGSAAGLARWTVVDYRGAECAWIIALSRLAEARR